jgi:hypothetical protein
MVEHGDDAAHCANGFLRGVGPRHTGFLGVDAALEPQRCHDLRHHRLALPPSRMPGGSSQDVLWSFAQDDLAEIEKVCREELVLAEERERH